MRLKFLLVLFCCIFLISNGSFAQTKPADYVAHVSDESLTFGSCTVNTVTGTVYFYFNDYTGEGDATLTISGPFRFASFTGEDLGKSAVTPGMFGSAYIQFAPTGAGAANGSLTITLSNGANKIIPLSGTGIPLATLTASPSAVDFGSEVTGTEAYKLITITGTNITSDTRVEVTGPFSAGGTIPSTYLAGGKKFDIGVSFYAGTTGSSTGSIKLTTSGGSGAPDISIIVSLTGTCIPQPTAPTEENAIGGAAGDQQAIVAEPIQLGTGSYEYSHNDFRLAAVSGPFNFSRFYNSINNSVDGPLGFGWSHSFNYKLTTKTDPVSNQDQQWNLRYPDGHVSAFIPKGTGSYPLYIGTTDSLQKNSGGDFTLFTKDNHQYHFTSAGELDRISDLNGNVTTLNYSAGNLVNAVSQGGRKYTFTYNGTKLASVTDPLSRVCNYSYDAGGNLKNVTDAKGGVTSFTYNTAHSLLTVINPLGNTLVNNTYDATGKVTKQLDANNAATLIAYNTPSTGDATVTNPDNSQMVTHHDDSFRKTSIRDELGFTKYYSYDAYSNENSFTDENSRSETRQFDKPGNLLSTTYGGNSVSYTYNAFNSPVKLTDRNGNVTNLAYDNHDNLVSMKLPDNTTQSFTYNSNGLRTAYQDGRGNKTTYSYAATGDLLSVTTPAGTKAFQYDLAGRPTVITDENGNSTKTAYDNNDNILSTTDALNHKIVFTYDANNQLLSTVDKNGNTTSFTYDKKDRLSTKTDANGGIAKYAYDTRDNIISVTDANNNTISYAYDKKNRKTGVTNALGTAQYQYDGVGNLLKLTDAAGLAMDYTYTATNKVKTKQDGMSDITTYNYDKNDNVISVTDPLSRTTGYTYDALNRLIEVLDAARSTTRITYDENGNKKTVTDPKGHIQTNTYDNANRLTSARDAAGNTTSYSYDAADNTVSITTPSGTVSKVYDVLNRVTAVNNSTGDNYSFSYDNVNNIIAMTSSPGKTTMAYDKLNKLIEYTDPYSKKIKYTYDAVGNKKSITYPGNKIVNYTYDKANDLATVSDWMNHTFTYSYDAGGKNTRLLYPNGIHTDMAYDPGGRLTGKKSFTAANVVLTGSTFTLDANGNRLTEQKTGAMPANLKPAAKTYTYGNDDRMEKDSLWTFVNDNAGNRISETQGKRQASYTFSVDNRLSKKVDTLSLTSVYGYDAMGNRLSRSLGNTTNHYVTDISGQLSQVLQVTDGSGAVRSQYVSGNGLLERVDSTGNASYYLYDAQHNTAAIADGTGTITDTYAYDPFGTLLDHKGTTSQPFVFLGEYGVEQENNSLYYARARYYDAGAGRFLSKDPYPYSLDNPQTMNRYVYGLNNPLAKSDPSGLFAWASAQAATGQLIIAMHYSATTAVDIWALSKVRIGRGRIGGTSAVGSVDASFSSVNDFNQSIKYYKAAGKNFLNAFQSNNDFVNADFYNGPLDGLTDSRIFKTAKLVSNIAGTGENLYNSPTTLTDVWQHFADEWKSSFADLPLFTSLIELAGQIEEGKELEDEDIAGLINALNAAHCDQF